RVFAPPSTSSICLAATESSWPACCTSPNCCRMLPSICVEACNCSATAFCAVEVLVPTEALPLCTCWVTCPSCAATVCAGGLICAAVACDSAASNDCISLRSASPCASATLRALSATKIPNAPRIAMIAAALHPIILLLYRDSRNYGGKTAG